MSKIRLWGHPKSLNVQKQAWYDQLEQRPGFKRWLDLRLD